MGQNEIKESLFINRRSYGLKCKNEKLKAKNGFLSWPNMALTIP